MNKKMTKFIAILLTLIMVGSFVASVIVYFM